jgi:SPOR domain
MAEDQFQRAFRASEPPVRGPAKTPGNDPLAELARLIGQTDPFGEFGRESARRAPAPRSDEFSDWNTQPLGTRSSPAPAADSRAGLPPQRPAGSGYYAARSTPPEQQVDPLQGFGAQSYERQTHGGTPTAQVDPYQPDRAARGYQGQADYQQDEVQDAEAHEPQDAYDQDYAQQTDDDYYYEEDMPPPRRRLGVMAIAGVLALAVIGTAGAFGYRAVFGSSGSPQPPPVIKADAGPTKIVPAAAGKDAQSNKLITDRVNERGQSEKLVSREEQPIDKPANVVLAQAPQQSAMGTGVVGSEPKKVRTIAIHPDQAAVADASAPGASPLAAAPTARGAPPAAPAAKPPAPPPARVANNSTADAEEDAAPAPAARAATRPAAPPPANSPLPLNPDPSAKSAAPPTRTATVAPTAQAAPPAVSSAAAGPGSYVQISSQRSEAEAQNAFRGLQAKYPDQLGGRPLQVLKVDLGAKGTYYRAMVGPFSNANEAAELCSSLKSAGGQCLIQRN